MDLRAIPDNERLLNLYRAYLTMQCGLADNTSLAYTEDVRKLLSYLDDESVPLADAGYPALENFLATLNDLGISLKSTSRIVSGVKSFFRYLRMERFIADDPALLLQKPRVGTHLPEVLSVDEINDLINAIPPRAAGAAQQGYCRDPLRLRAAGVGAGESRIVEALSTRRVPGGTG